MKTIKVLRDVEAFVFAGVDESDHDIVLYLFFDGRELKAYDGQGYYTSWLLPADRDKFLNMDLRSLDSDEHKFEFLRQWMSVNDILCPV